MDNVFLQLPEENALSNRNASAMHYHSNVFVALGLQEHDPGYSIVVDAMQQLGKCTCLHESLWLVQGSHSLPQLFKKINTSMMDRRIGSANGVFLLNANERMAKWYFSPLISEVLNAYWSYRHSFFVACKLRNHQPNEDSIFSDIRALGTWTPISKSLWYINSAYTSKEAFQILISRMDKGDQLCILDSTGNVATWQDRSSEITWLPTYNDDHRPNVAHIHISPTHTEKTTISDTLSISQAA